MILELPIPGFDGFDGVFKRSFQDVPADGSQHDAQQPPLQVLALSHDQQVNVGDAVGRRVKV